MHKFQQAVILNFLPSGSEVQQIHHVDILIVCAAHWVNSIVKGAVEAAQARVSTESHDIGTATVVLVEVPVLVRPHFSRATDTDLSLINDEWDALSGS